MIKSLSEGKTLWGQGNPEPVIIAENITIDIKDIQIIGAYKDTMKFVFNGITYIKFKAKNLIEELFLQSGKINISAAGRANINTYGGQETPQILLEEIEVKECSEEDF